MSSKAQPLEWKSSGSEAVVEEEPRVAIECLKPFMVGGAMAKPGQQVRNVPDHMARSLVERGSAKVLADGV